MELGALITKFRKEANLTIDELSIKSGVPKGTINKIIAGTTKAPTLENIRALAYAMGKTLNDFDTNYSSVKNAPPISGEAKRIAKRYDKLDAHGKEAVCVLIDCEEKRIVEAMPEPATQKLKVIPLFGNSFAAGLGEPDFGNIWEDYEVDSDSNAEFAIKINGDSMEPYLHDGSIALGKKGTPKDGDVAVLIVDGEFLVKQVVEDSIGNLYLFSLNRSRSDADRTLWAKDEHSVMCFGTVIMDRRAPLP